MFFLIKRAQIGRGGLLPKALVISERSPRSQEIAQAMAMPMVRCTQSIRGPDAISASTLGRCSWRWQQASGSVPGPVWFASACGDVDVEYLPQSGSGLGVFTAGARDSGVSRERGALRLHQWSSDWCGFAFAVTGWCWLLRLLPLGNGGRKVNRLVAADRPLRGVSWLNFGWARVITSTCPIWTPTCNSSRAACLVIRARVQALRLAAFGLPFPCTSRRAGGD